MASFPSARETEWLLSGNIASDDLPDEATGLARFITAMRSPLAPAGDPKAEQRIVASFVLEIRKAGATQPALVMASPRRRRLSRRAAAATLIGMLASGTAVAAAATGSLPAGVQQAFANALAHVDISIPHPAHHAPVDTPPRTADNQHVQARHAIGPAVAGTAALCTAVTHGPTAGSRSERDDAPAFSALRRTAAAQGMTIGEYCHAVTSPAGNNRTQKDKNTTTTSVVTTPVPDQHSGHTKTPTGAGHRPPTTNAHNGNLHTTHPAPTSPHRPNGHGNGHTPHNTSGSPNPHGHTNLGS